jgi:hypothetical protein
MDYSDDSCMTEFTPGQTVAMIASYIELRAVAGSIVEVEDNDEGSTPASTSDNLSQQSETTGSNNVDDGSEPSENVPQTGNDGGFSANFGFSQGAASGNTGSSGFFFPQNNAGTSAPLSSSFGSFGSFGSGNGGGGFVAPTAGIFTLSSITVDAAPSPVAASSQACGASLKAKGELCTSDLQCCTGVCAATLFFNRCA